MRTDDFAVETGELGKASSSLRGCARAIRELSLNPPDVSMYGRQVDAAARSVEPSTTDEINNLIATLGNAVDLLATKMDQTRDAYDNTERDNQSHAQSLQQSGEC